MKKVSFFKVLTISLILAFSMLLPGLIPNPAIAKAADLTVDTDTVKVKLNVGSKSLVKEQSYTLKVYRMTKNQKVSFKSSDTDIVTVKKEEDKTAVITGIRVGEATITATIKEGFKTIATLKCSITVTPPAVCITFTENDLVLEVGDTITLKKELKPATPYPTAEMPVYVVKNPKIVALSKNKPGTITALSPGKTIIYATISNGNYDTCTVTVKEKETTSETLNTKES